MFGSKPKQPKTPDPNVVSDAQTRSNQQTAQYEAALAHGNTTTPYGSQTYTPRVDPTTGATVYDQSIKLDPRVQGQLDQQIDHGTQLVGAQGDALARVRDAYSQPMNTSGAPALRDAPQMNSYRSTIDTNNLPGLQSGYQNFYNTGQLPELQSELNVNGPDLQGQIDMSNMPELYGAADLEGARTQTQDALYQRQAAYLDPQWQQREAAFRTRMNNQGVVEGSEAFRNALDDENRARTFEYDQARTGAIAGGRDEMATLSGIASNNRGQTYGERANNATFTNNARAQAMTEAMNRGTFNNNARAQGFNEQGQMTDESMRAAGFTNDARAQGFGERAAETNVANVAAGATNADALRAAQFGNDARTQSMQEMYNARALPLNEFNALRDSAPVEMPQFENAPNTSVAPTNTSGNIWNAYQGELDMYNSAQSGQNSMMGGLMNLGGQLGSAWITSDERVKEGITPAGKLPDGTNVYDYYKGGRPERGVLAQEVEKRNPKAVKTGRDGFKRVNYREVMARAMAAA